MPSTDQTHVHGPGCGHIAVRHEDHVDYLNHGHLEHDEGGHTDEHVVEISSTNPDRCNSKHRASGHKEAHGRGRGCGHEAVPMGTMLIIWSMDAYTTRLAIVATTTVRWR